MTLTRMVRRLIAAAAVVVTAAAPARADFVLDDFSAPNPAVSYQISGANPNPYSFSTNLAGGTVRTITLSVTSPIPPQFDSLSGSTGGDFGVFYASLNPFSRGTAVIDYTFGSAQNFTPGTPGQFQIVGYGDPDLNNVAATYALSVTTTTGTRTATGSLPNALQTLPIDLAALGGSGDLTQVTGLSLTLTGGTAADIVIDALSVTTSDTPPNAIPAPPAALLALAAVPVFALRRRFAKA